LGLILSKSAVIGGFMGLIDSADKSIQLKFMQMMSQRENHISIKGSEKQTDD